MKIQNLNKSAAEPQHLTSYWPWLLLALAQPLSVNAQALPDERSAPDAQQLEAVTVSARRSIEQRFDAAGSLVVVDRKDIAALGAFSVVDVLRQLPSVQVTPNGQGGVEIRMRGMEASATQLLIDGQRVSSGKSSLPLDQLPSELIERIEVVRAPTAEFSGATGGTLNIVLRAATVKRETTLQLTDNHVWGQNAGQLYFSQSGPLGANPSSTKVDTGTDAPPVKPWTYFVAASRIDYLIGSDVQRQTLSGGQFTSTTDTVGRYRRSESMLLPKVSGRIGPSDQLTLRATLSQTEFDGTALASGTTWRAGSPYALRSEDVNDYQRQYLQLAADWTHRFDRSKLDTTLHGARSNYSLNRQGSVKSQGSPNTDYSLADEQRDRQWTLKSKLTGTDSPLLWSAGVELDSVSLDALTINTDTLRGSSRVDMGAKLQRQIIWGQNEWELPGKITLTGGLRAETLALTSADAAVLPERRMNFIQPSLHTRTAIGKDMQWRLNLARVTRNPAARDLFNRSSPSVGANSITNPDNAGNPDLRPEVAWSLDTGLDQRLGGQGQLGLNLFVRQLSDTLATLVTPVNGRWVQTRANVGDATVWGLEADVKTGLTWAGLGRDWTLSSNASLLQSRMTSGPSQGNRIPGQARYTASVNVAKPLRRTGGLFGGATLSLTGPTQLNTSPGITGQDHARAALDVYIGRVQPTWGFWRVGVYNIGNARFNRDRHYADASGNSWQDSSSMTLTPRVYLSVGTQFCGAFQPC